MELTLRHEIYHAWDPNSGGLNPSCDGTDSQTTKYGPSSRGGAVLILLVMELTLRRHHHVTEQLT